ncbi:MAG: YceI family protein [Gemmatirosa sp.]|nr:YceI family protein [Gemmatirosa sp.]
MRFRHLMPALATVAVATLPAAAQRPVAALKAATPKPAAVAVYQIDATHSELSFRIRHLLGRVSGSFGEWGGTIAIDSAAPANSRVDVAIKTATIDTKNQMRDNHLRSADFFAADSFPAITFKSTKVTVQGQSLRVAGDLTIRGRTKPVVLVGEYAGAFRDAQGTPRTAFTASTTINRNDFGVAWNKAVESGAMLGDDVTIEISVEAVRM